jgi:hypothetical protein
VTIPLNMNYSNKNCTIDSKKTIFRLVFGIGADPEKNLLAFLIR